MDEYIEYKKRFNRSLEPIKVMLVNGRSSWTPEEWIRFVERTKISIVQNPDQYLGNELPDPALLTAVIENIFTDFMLHINRPDTAEIIAE